MNKEAWDNKEKLIFWNDEILF